MAPHDLDWSGCANARDLGGLPAAGGARVRERALVRTDDLTRLDQAGRETFEAHGVALIVDLRFLFEIQMWGHPYRNHPTYRHLPFIPDAFHAERDEVAEHTNPLDHTYGVLLDASKKTVAAALGVIATAADDAPEGEPLGPVVVHCAGGKDRTGMLVALLLDLVGVPRDLIARDYARSEERLEILAGLAALDGTPEQIAWETVTARTLPASILGALAHLDRTYGGTRAYLRECGLTDAELDRLTAWLVEPASPASEIAATGAS